MGFYDVPSTNAASTPFNTVFNLVFHGDDATREFVTCNCGYMVCLRYRGIQKCLRPHSLDYLTLCRIGVAARTVERTSWYFVGLDISNLIGHAICEDTYTTYFTGGEISASLLDSEEYKFLFEKRVSKVNRFVKTPHYTSSSIKACVSSSPRWRYVSEMNADPRARKKQLKQTDLDDSSGQTSDDERFERVSAPEDLRGVARGQKGLLEESRNILKGRDDLVDLIINREEDEKAIRLETYRSIASTALYMADKNLPYTGNPYRVIRGEYDARDYCYSIRGMPYCCSDS